MRFEGVSQQGASATLADYYTPRRRGNKRLMRCLQRQKTTGSLGAERRRRKDVGSAAAADNNAAGYVAVFVLSE